MLGFGSLRLQFVLTEYGVLWQTRFSDLLGYYLSKILQLFSETKNCSSLTRLNDSQYRYLLEKLCSASID
jgi:hypothetical protein